MMGRRINEIQKIEIVDRVAKDESKYAIARDMGIGKSSVFEIAKERREEIDAKRTKLQLMVLQKLEEDNGEMADEMIATAKDRDAKGQAQCGRVMFEAGGLIGRGGNVHIGDVNTHLTQINIDPEIAAARAKEYDPERLAELKRMAGLD